MASRLWLFFLPLMFVVNAQADLQWQDIEARSLASQSGKTGRLLRTDAAAMRRYLQQAPQAASGTAALIVTLPLPNGEQRRFYAVESAVMDAALAAKYPQIKTYRVSAVGDSSSTGRIGYGPRGLHAMLSLSDLGTVIIDPAGSESVYRSFLKGQARESAEPQMCLTQPEFSPDWLPAHQHESQPQQRSAARTFGQVKVLRMALAASVEYTQRIQGSGTESEKKTAVLAEMNTLLSRANQIYERDLALSFQLVDGTDALIFTATDPFEDNLSDPDPAGQMLDVIQPVMDAAIGSANYDIGHVLSINGGGLAQLKGACDASLKAQGVSGHTNPQNDVFYVDYFSHEVGHQLGANHIYNGTAESCGTNRVQATALEPGSGSSVMGYAGICGAEDVQANTDATFHAASLREIDSFVSALSCGSQVLYNNLSASTNNYEPIADAGPDYIIPARTPFRLDASQSCDEDMDPISFSWDQMDAGTATNASTYGTTGSDFGDNALFRTYLPSGRNFRDFPAIENLLDTDFRDAAKAEVLPQTTRDLNFRVVVRDGKGGVSHDDVKVQVENTGSAFAVTSVTQNTVSTQQYDIQWNVAGTDQAPIHCPSVNVDLLTFAGRGDYSSYGVTRLASGMQNNGQASVSVPANKTSVNAHFRVSCANNVFYAISPTTVIINGSGAELFPSNEFSAKGTVADLQPPVASCAGKTLVTATTSTTDTGTTGASAALGQGGGGGSLPLSVLLALWVSAYGRRFFAS